MQSTSIRRKYVVRNDSNARNNAQLQVASRMDFHMNRYRVLVFGLAFCIAATFAASGEGGVGGQAPAHPSTALSQKPGVSIAISQPQYGYNVLPGVCGGSMRQ